MFSCKSCTIMNVTFVTVNDDEYCNVNDNVLCLYVLADLRIHKHVQTHMSNQIDLNIIHPFPGQRFTSVKSILTLNHFKARHSTRFDPFYIH